MKLYCRPEYCSDIYRQLTVACIVKWSYTINGEWGMTCYECSTTHHRNHSLRVMTPIEHKSIYSGDNIIIIIISEMVDVTPAITMYYISQEICEGCAAGVV